MDAIVFMSGGLVDNGKLHEWTKRRADAILAMKPKCYVICTAGYTVHKRPFIDARGFPVIEADVMADYLVERGLPKKQILVERFSSDTIVSAFLTRVLHTDPRRLRSLLIVTSEFHMPRVQAVFEWVMNLKPHGRYKLEFLSVSDEGIPADIISPRRLKEMKATQSVMSLRKHIKTVQQFVNWMYSEHEAYAYGLTPKQAPLDQKKSY